MKSWFFNPKRLTLTIILILLGLSWLEPNPSTATVNVQLVRREMYGVTFPTVVGRHNWSGSGGIYGSSISTYQLYGTGSSSRNIRIIPADEESLKRVIKYYKHGDKNHIQRALSWLAPWNW